MSAYVAEVEWALEGDFALGRYSREHLIRFDGGARVTGSSSPAVVPLPYSLQAGVDPEEMFTASLSACHMLWFLHKDRDAKLVVRRYVDRAEATMAKDETGRLSMTEVVLSPKVTFTEPGPTAEQLAELHHQAHEACFIANSVKTKVRIQIST